MSTESPTHIAAGGQSGAVHGTDISISLYSVSPLKCNFSTAEF